MTSIDLKKENAQLKEEKACCENQYKKLEGVNKNLRENLVEGSKTNATLTKENISLQNQVIELQDKAKHIRAEAIGWAHADACVDLDAGGDPRTKNIPEMLERANHDLDKKEEPNNLAIEETGAGIEEKDFNNSNPSDQIKNLDDVNNLDNNDRSGCTS